MIWTPPRSVSEFVEAIGKGDRVFIGQAITYLESLHPEKRAFGEAILNTIMDDAPERSSFRIAITGAPGAGKSTFIEKIGSALTAQGHRIAVLAIDPSSSVTKGSLMGDKTRMEKLSADPLAFIRPSPAGETLGGVARKTRETILLLEAAGYEYLFVETVGVGQSEITVHGMTDLFVLLLLPGAGDELQGIKRGIVEMADIVIVNKSDGDRVPLARITQTQYQNALHLFPGKRSGWKPTVLPCSAQENENLDTVWAEFVRYQGHVVQNGWLGENRKMQSSHWWHEAMAEGLKTAFYSSHIVQEKMESLEKMVEMGKMSPVIAANLVLHAFFETR